MEAWLVWLIIAGLMFVLEMITVGFLVFWFAIAAVLTAILSFFTTSLPIQISFFIIVSVLLVIFTKPLVNKFIQKGTGAKTNVYTVIGKTALVTNAIDPKKSTGQIKIDSDVWSAKSENGEAIEEGASVEILRIEGVKVIVKKI